MSVRNVTNHAASVYAKLKNIAHNRHLDFTRLLTRPVALTDEFADNKMKQVQWKAFLCKSGLPHAPQDLHEIIARLAAFLLPVLHSEILQSGSWDRHTGKWTHETEAD